MYVLQQIINGLCQGSIYALMAIGYTMIFGVVGLVSFSYGETVMIGAFASLYIFMFTGNLVLGLVGGFLAAAVLGFFGYKICVEHFLTSPRYISMICTVSFSMFVRNLAQNIFGEEVKPVPEIIPVQSYEFAGGLRITNMQLIVMGVVIIAVIILSIFLNKTRAGTMLRAVSQDRTASALVGINVKRTTMLGNCLGSALGGVGGVLLGLYYTTVVATIGSTVGLKSIISTVLGGLNSIAGSASSAVIVGVLENMGVMIIPTGLKDVIAFAFLVIVLLVKPQGLFARRGNR